MSSCAVVAMTFDLTEFVAISVKYCVIALLNSFLALLTVAIPVLAVANSVLSVPMFALIVAKVPDNFAICSFFD